MLAAPECGDGPERAAPQLGRSMSGHAGIWYGVPLFGTDEANGAPIALRFRQVFFAASDLTVDPWKLLSGTISFSFRQEGVAQ